MVAHFNVLTGTFAFGKNTLVISEGSAGNLSPKHSLARALAVRMHKVGK